MSYETAKKCFSENVRLVSPPGSDLTRATLWNLNAGLTRLTDAIHQDIGHLEAQIDALRREIQQLRKQR
jgi:hypothetical protein